jgi:hypothetical protein
VTNSLTQVGSFSAHAGHPWLSWAFDRATLYGAERDGWASYAVNSPLDLTFQSNLTLRGRCDGGNFKHGTTSVLAEQKAPYNIFGAGRSPCGNVMSSRVDGSLERHVQNITFQPSSRVHGMALDAENSYLYSADVSANGIWTHKIDPVKGTLSNAKFKTHSEANARPRRLAVHPKGRYLYILMSKLNKVVVYDIKMQSSGPVLTNTGQSYSLVPPGKPIIFIPASHHVTLPTKLIHFLGVNESNYRGHELALSADSNILYVTSRYRVQRREEDDDDDEKDEEGEEDDDEKVGAVDDEDSRFNQRNSQEPNPTLRKRQFPYNLFGGSSTSARATATAAASSAATVQPGFLTAILLTSQDGVAGTQRTPVGAGYPIQVILQVSTSTSGGKSNSVTPAHWGNEFVALADSEKGLVQVWRFDGLGDLPKDVPGPAPVAAPRPPVKITPQPLPQPTTQQNPRPASTSATSTTTTATRPPPWQYPNGQTGSSGRGWGGNAGTKRDLERRQNAFANVRANIVAEWKAPLDSIGEGDPAAPRSKTREGEDRRDKKPQWGRGCCANAVWYD